MATKGQSTQDVITTAARNLFYHRGYASTSYADISKRSGHGKGNIQYHFNAKDDLLAAVVDQRIDEIRRTLEAWSLECGTYLDCLERFIDMTENNAADLAQYGCPIGTLNDELGKTDRQLQQGSRQMFDLFLAWLEARFRAVFPANEAREKAEFLMIMAQGASVLAHAYNSTELIHRHAINMRAWLATTRPAPPQ